MFVLGRYMVHFVLKDIGLYRNSGSMDEGVPCLAGSLSIFSLNFCPSGSNWIGDLKEGLPRISHRWLEWLGISGESLALWALRNACSSERWFRLAFTERLEAKSVAEETSL